jgi:DNA sulfur modification protein DndB
MTDVVKYLDPLLTDKGRIRREATKRRDRFERISVPSGDVPELVADGWETDKELKVRTRLRRPRPAEDLLEDRTWFLMYLMGYHELNSGRHFEVLIERKGAAPTRKQVDVFAKDDETVVVAECKASEVVKRRSLQKDLEELGSLKGAIAAAVKNHYGSSFKPKIIWLFVTQNIIWSQPDRDRAAGLNIRIITERELRYYMQIADHLRGAARFQFLAEFLKDQRIPGLADRRVPAIRGKLGGHRFYSFVTTPAELLKIAFINHRSLDDPDGAPTYQRLVSRSRMKEISKFLAAGGFFPTNLLVNFPEKVRFDVVSKDEGADVAYGHLYLPDRYRSVWVIDGQHRLYGFAQLPEKYLHQHVMVVAFEQLARAEEADLFVTINHEQKSVPRTLLEDLKGELKWGSTVPSERIGAIGARVIRALNMDIGEPFYQRVAQQGIRATEKTCLTVPALMDGLRHSGLIGRAILGNQEYAPGPFSGTTDGETLDRAQRGLNSFFALIRGTNEARWEAGRGGLVCTNIAVQAFLQLLGELVTYMEGNRGLAARELSPEEMIGEVEEYLEPVVKWLEQASQAHLEQELKVQYGSGGPPEYFFRLARIVREQYSDFEPTGMADWLEERSTERIEAADRKLKEINILVQKHIFDVFRTHYGTASDAYWEKGVIDKSIKTKAYEKSLDDEAEERLPLENYLEFIEYKTIVENKAHWPLFKPVFDIPLPGDKGYSKNIGWMQRVNELRRIPAHATESRHYKLDDFAFIDFVYARLCENLEREDGKPASAEPAANGADS